MANIFTRRIGRTDEKAGFDINWLNAGLAVVAIVLAAIGQHLWDVNPGLFSGWSFFGFALIGVFGLLEGGVIVAHQKFKNLWTLIVAQLIAIIIVILVLSIVLVLNVGWVAVVTGLVGFLIEGGIVAFIAMTRWWRYTGYNN